MSVRTFLSASFAAAALFAAPAAADDLQLSAAELEQAGEACRSGTTLLPVQSDFGTETGQYAIPLKSERSGRANSAIILDQNALKDLPDCEARIAQADWGNDLPQPNAAIS